MGPDVYAVGANGIGLRKAGDGSAGGKVGPNTSFDMSPDGQIVYSACYWKRGGDGDEYELALVDVDGAEVVRLTKDDRFDNYPVWSPEGARIAFLWNSEVGDDLARSLNVYTMAADGTDRRLEAGDAAHHPPQWSPDGERIAYVQFEGPFVQDPAIYTVAVGGGDVQRLTDAVSGPSWSPDGERIAFAKADGDEVALYTIGSDGSDARRLAAIDGWQYQLRYEGSDPERAWIRKVSWSPDGSKILFLARSGAFFAIHIVGADGSGGALIAPDKLILQIIEEAAWSPDGKRIAIVGDFMSEKFGAAGQIALLTIGVDGTAVPRVPRVLVGRQRDGSLVGLGVERGDISAEVAACGGGVVVPNPEANPGGVEDCKALLEVQNALAGPGGLNWLVDRDIREWDGIVVDGTPPRVREVRLARRGLVGEIPTELSRLTELRLLDLWDNSLMGEMPGELGELRHLERLILSENLLSGDIPVVLRLLTGLEVLLLNGNRLTGCIPEGLRDIKLNDLDDLESPDCE